MKKGRNYELKRGMHHLGSLILGHYTAEVKIKERWWNCNDAMLKSMEEGKVVAEAAYIHLHKQT